MRVAGLHERGEVSIGLHARPGLVARRFRGFGSADGASWPVGVEHAVVAALMAAVLGDAASLSLVEGHLARRTAAGRRRHHQLVHHLAHRTWVIVPLVVDGLVAVRGHGGEEALRACEDTTPGIMGQAACASG